MWVITVAGHLLQERSQVGLVCILWVIIIHWVHTCRRNSSYDSEWLAVASWTWWYWRVLCNGRWPMKNSWIIQCSTRGNRTLPSRVFIRLQKEITDFRHFVHLILLICIYTYCWYYDPKHLWNKRHISPGKSGKFGPAIVLYLSEM